MIGPDAIVVVRGRLDHKERGETKLVVQEAERFEPDAEEIARASEVPSGPSGPVEVEVEAAQLTDVLVEELKAVLEHHKGDAEVHLAIRTAAGESKRLLLGEGYRVRPSGRLRASWTTFSAPPLRQRL